MPPLRQPRGALRASPPAHPTRLSPKARPGRPVALPAAVGLPVPLSLVSFLLAAILQRREVFETATEWRCCAGSRASQSPNERERGERHGERERERARARGGRGRCVSACERALWSKAAGKCPEILSQRSSWEPPALPPPLPAPPGLGPPTAPRREGVCPTCHPAGSGRRRRG